MTTPKINTKDTVSGDVVRLLTERPEGPYNRFVEDGYGLIIDNSEVEEALDFSPLRDDE